MRLLLLSVFVFGFYANYANAMKEGANGWPCDGQNLHSSNGCAASCDSPQYNCTDRGNNCSCGPAMKAGYVTHSKNEVQQAPKEIKAFHVKSKVVDGVNGQSINIPGSK